MPRGDGTGPMGMGPMTGRAAGFCAGFGMPGFANPAPGRGFGGGGGGRRGWRNMYHATGLPGWMRFSQGGVASLAEPTPEVERNFLKLQAEALQAQLDEVKKRLAEVETAEVKK